MSGLVRVFVPTYQRSHLLPRALQSLLAQSYPHWVAEVRNDAPGDDAPAGVVRQFKDARIRYARHERNLGGVVLFNQIFDEQPEPYVALLEDDNWWRPDFLERMVSAMEANPDVTLAWSNQSIWEESSSGDWSDTGRFARRGSAGRAPVRAHWPHPLQCFGALHANGAMLLRTRRGISYPTPPMEFGGTEAVRERSLPHPLLYMPEPLAVFSVTRTTHRSKDSLAWASIQVLLAATFLKHVKAPPPFWHALWAGARAASPRMTGTLLLAIRQEKSLRHHFAHAQPDDWRQLAFRSLRRPALCVQLLRTRRREPGMWAFLDAQTAARAREAISSAIPSAEPDVLFK